MDAGTAEFYGPATLSQRLLAVMCVVSSDIIIVSVRGQDFFVNNRDR